MPTVASGRQINYELAQTHELAQKMDNNSELQYNEKAFKRSRGNLVEIEWILGRKNRQTGTKANPS